jgi:hypothetical protein
MAGAYYDFNHTSLFFRFIAAGPVPTGLQPVSTYRHSHKVVEVEGDHRRSATCSPTNDQYPVVAPWEMALPSLATGVKQAHASSGQGITTMRLDVLEEDATLREVRCTALSALLVAGHVAFAGWFRRGDRPARCPRYLADTPEVNFRHAHVERTEHRVREFVVTLEVAA